jgi:ribose 5-phosphate isomerase B
MSTTLVIGSDHAGFALKEQLKAFLHESGYEVLDVGCETQASCDYPVFAAKAADLVATKGYLGILICGSGVGMCMAAGRHPGVRAVLGANEYLARMSRRHNNANVLCLGERWMGVGLAQSVATAFLETQFEGGRHQRRIDLFEAM